MGNRLFFPCLIPLMRKTYLVVVVYSVLFQISQVSSVLSHDYNTLDCLRNISIPESELLIAIREKLHAHIYEHRTDSANVYAFEAFKSALQQMPSEFRRNFSLPRVKNIAFLKTHKTGSTTLASILYRYAARHHARMYLKGLGTVLPTFEISNHLRMLSDKEKASTIEEAHDDLDDPPIHEIVLNSGNNTKNNSNASSASFCPPGFPEVVYDMSLQHTSALRPLHVPFRDLVKFYNSIIPDANIISIIREPISHAISYACYFYAPKTLEEFERVVEFNLTQSSMSWDFGVWNITRAYDFLANDSNLFAFMCLTEEFDECLIMMRRLFNWDLLDITYLRLLANTEGR